MKSSNSITILGVVLTLLAGSVAAGAQWNKKPYNEWSEKEAQKVLDDSPWGQTQVFTNTSRMFSTGPGRGNAGSAPQEGSADNINFRIRFLSATPIRQAFSRIIEIKQKGEVNDQLANRLKAFSSPGAFPDYIVISVIVDSREQKGQLQQAESLLQTRTTAELQNNTYIVIKGGQRVFIQEFQPPKKDGLGAKFIFSRMVDGKPAISEDTGEIKFYSELSKDYILNMRFKVKDMMFDGKLDY